MIVTELRRTLYNTLMNSIRAGVVCLLLISSTAYALDSSIEKVVPVTSADTFESIAQQVFGAGGLGIYLAEYNKLPYNATFATGFEVLIPVSDKPRENFAEVVYKKGDALVYPGGSQVTAVDPVAPFRININDRIQTGESGFVSLRFSTGTIVNVQPMSNVILARLSCLETDEHCIVDLDTDGGGVTADVEHRDHQSTTFTINTPYASAAVRGTVFDFDASSRALLVGVTEGSVDVLSSGEPISLATGRGVKTLPGIGSLKPVSLLQAPKFFSVPPRITEEDVISWKSTAKATLYQVSLTLRPQGNEEQYRAATSNAWHSLEQTNPGAVFLNVRAQDKEGFKGYTASVELNRVNMNSTLKGPELILDNKAADHLFISPVMPDSLVESVEIQFSATADFSNMISVDVPLNGGAVLSKTEQYFARARALLSAEEVSRFGPVVQISSD